MEKQIQNKEWAKETKVGNCKIVFNSHGSLSIYKNYYTKDGLEKSAGYPTADEIHLDSESVEILKNFLYENSSTEKLYGGKSVSNHNPYGLGVATENQDKKIDYRDKCYPDKRKILRQLSLKDEIRNFLDIVTDEVFDKIMYKGGSCAYESIKDRIGIDMSDIDFWHYIRTLLIDGFLSFEVIFDNKSKPIDLKQLDPLSLLCQVDPQTNNKFWIQYPDNDIKKRILTDKQIIYLSYSANSDYITSYVEELKESYERLKMIESAVFFPPKGTQFQFPSMNVLSVEWLYKSFVNISRIPSSMLSYEDWSPRPGDERCDKRYNKFINRIYNVFVSEMFDKILELK